MPRNKELEAMLGQSVGRTLQPYNLTLGTQKIKV